MQATRVTQHVTTQGELATPITLRSARSEQDERSAGPPRRVGRPLNRLPRHVRSLDVCGFEPGGQLISVGKVEEFCLLTEYVSGESYSHDLERLRDTGELLRS